MKPISSAITGLPERARAQPSSIGSPHGGHGVAAPSNIVAPKVNPEVVDKGLQFLTQFAKRGQRGEGFDPVMIQQAEGYISQIDGRCDWGVAVDYLNAMIYAYSRPGDDPKTIKTLASEFMSVLDEYPTWAVVRAMRWWQSDGNSFHHVRPRHGDITAKCREITAPLRVAKGQIAKAIGLDVGATA